MLSVNAPATAMTRGANVLSHSIERGDWDDDTCDRMAAAIGALTRAAESAPEPGALVTARLEVAVADEVDAILGCDVNATTTLAPLLDALGSALNAAP